MNFFVKESYGVIWHFYHNSHGICFCRMKDENISEYQVLLPEGQEDFDVLIDDSDCIHLVCQNIDGDIVYINHFNGQWRKATLLKAKTSSNYRKDFSVKRVNNWLNLFYCIEYNGKRMLTYQIIDNTDATPYVIDCIKGDFYTAQDSLGNMYLLFYSEANRTWGIKKYIWSKKEWTEFESVSELEGCKSAFLYIDGDDKMHIVYNLNSGIMEYFDGSAEMVGTGQNPVMLFQNHEIIMWEGVCDNKIYIKRRGENAPTVFMPGGFSKPVKYRLRYTCYEPNLKAECCFGNIVNGTVRTYGVNNFFAVAEKPPVPSAGSHENHSDTSDADTAYLEIRKMKIQLSQMSMVLDKIQSRLENIDIEKINRRLDEIEGAVNKNTRPRLFNLL